MHAAIYILKMNLIGHLEKHCHLEVPMSKISLNFVSFPTIFVYIQIFFNNQTLMFLSSPADPIKIDFFPPIFLSNIALVKSFPENSGPILH